MQFELERFAAALAGKCRRWRAVLAMALALSVVPLLPVGLAGSLGLTVPGWSPLGVAHAEDDDGAAAAIRWRRAAHGTHQIVIRPAQCRSRRLQGRADGCSGLHRAENIDGKLARILAAAMPAHAIGYRPELEFGVDEKGILIGGASKSLMACSHTVPLHHK